MEFILTLLAVFEVWDANRCTTIRHGLLHWSCLYGREHLRIQKVLSTCVRISAKALLTFLRISEKRLTSLRGGIICLRRYFVYLSDVNQVISIRIVVNDFNYLGCEAGALYGDPKRIYASTKLCRLLQSPYLQALIAQAQPTVIASNSSINSGTRTLAV